MKAIIYILVLSLFIYSSFSQNTLKKYRGVVVPPLPNNFNVTAGWRCNVIDKTGTVNIGSNNPGIYIYFATQKSPYFAANDVTYIGKADKSISLKLRYHETTDQFCTYEASSLGRQYSCGYCYRPTYEGDSALSDYDTYFYEAMLLMTFCVEGKSADTGGKFTGEKCDLLNMASLDVLLTTNKLISYQLNTFVQNYIAPSNIQKSSLPRISNDAQFRDFAKMGKNDSISTPHSNSDPDCTTFVSLRTYGSLLIRLNGLLNYSVISTPSKPCLVEDLDQFMGQIMQNRIEIWRENYPQNSSQARDGSRLICYGTISDWGSFNLNQSFCEAYLYTGSVSKGGKYIQSFMVDLVVIRDYINSNDKVKFSSDFVPALEYELKAYYGSNNTAKIAGERNAFSYVISNFATALNNAEFTITYALPTPLPNC